MLFYSYVKIIKSNLDAREFETLMISTHRHEHHTVHSSLQTLPLT